jgi:hypothetical protein
MGHSLNLPHSTKSLPRCSNFWSGHVLFVIPFLANLIFFEKIGSPKQTKTPDGKIANIVIVTIKLVIKYFVEQMVSSSKVKVGMKVILGLSHLCIRMGLSGFNMEQNLNNST